MLTGQRTRPSAELLAAFSLLTPKVTHSQVVESSPTNYTYRARVCFIRELVAAVSRCGLLLHQSALSYRLLCRSADPLVLKRRQPLPRFASVLRMSDRQPIYILGD